MNIIFINPMSEDVHLRLREITLRISMMFPEVKDVIITVDKISKTIDIIGLSFMNESIIFSVSLDIDMTRLTLDPEYFDEVKTDREKNYG